MFDFFAYEFTRLSFFVICTLLSALTATYLKNFVQNDISGIFKEILFYLNLSVLNTGLANYEGDQTNRKTL